jgi:hypothetical protein
VHKETNEQCVVINKHVHSIVITISAPSIVVYVTMMCAFHVIRALLGFYLASLPINILVCCPGRRFVVHDPSIFNTYCICLFELLF